MEAPASKYRFILGLNFLKIREPLGKGDKLMDDCLITNDKSIARKFMRRELREQLGELEGWALLNAGTLIYHEGSIEDKFEQEDSMQLLTRFLNFVGLFQSSLWMVKDNAVNFEMGFLEVWPLVGKYRVQSNLLAQIVSKADSTKPETEFSRSEIRTAREFMQEFLLPLSLWTDEEVSRGTKADEERSYVISSHP